METKILEQLAQLVLPAVEGFIKIRGNIYQFNSRGELEY